MRNLPVLRGSFESKNFNFDIGMAAQLSFGTASLVGATAVVFSVEDGSSMLYWIANPADPELWDVLDRWAAAKMMLVATRVDNEREVLWTREFSLPDWAEELRQDVQNAKTITPAFVADVESWVRSGYLGAFAAVDHISKSKAALDFAKIQVRIVHTATTPALARTTYLTPTDAASKQPLSLSQNGADTG
jgi:hypothetical protein